jgi:hypothetical protein
VVHLLTTSHGNQAHEERVVAILLCCHPWQFFTPEGLQAADDSGPGGALQLDQIRSSRSWEIRERTKSSRDLDPRQVLQMRPERLIEALNLERAVVVGRSLGGHIVIELLSHYPQLRTMPLIIAPPVGQTNGKSDLSQGFKKTPSGSTAAKGAWEDA